MATEPVAGQVTRNIETIVRLEQAALERQSTADRIAARVAGFIGSPWFVFIHLAVVAVWIVVNRPGSPHRFDPYPYFLLVAIVAIEALLLSTFVLISQNQMARMAERRAHLNLQISLLAESEMTKMLTLLRDIAERMDMPGLETDEELMELTQPTEVESVVRVLDEALPNQPSPPPASEPGSAAGDH